MSNPAVVLVFPGYLSTVDVSKLSKDMSTKAVEEQKSQPYQEYLHNLQQLMQAFRNGQHLPLFLIGESDIGWFSPTLITHDNLADLQPPQDARRLYWEKAFSLCHGSYRRVGEVVGENGLFIISDVNTHPYIPESRKRHFDWDTLKASGIDIVLLGGEESVDRNGSHQSVVEIADEMQKKGLQIRGIQGCVYPLTPHHPLPNDWQEPVRSIIGLLYQQAVDPRTLAR